MFTDRIPSSGSSRSPAHPRPPFSEIWLSFSEQKERAEGESRGREQRKRAEGEGRGREQRERAEEEGRGRGQR